VVLAYPIPAFAIYQYVTGLQVPVDDVARVHVLDGVDQLVHDESLVNVLEDIALFDHIMQVAFHELEHQVKV